MAGMKVVGVKTDPQGNIDVGDLEAKARQHAGDLSALMVTYPSTHGVFEATIRKICDIVHAHGGPVYAAPWGSPSILPISWMYIRMMGAEGLARATELAILNANYIAKRLGGYFPVLYKGQGGLVAHECIIDLREAKKKADVEVED